ncbi:hypothetical protein [Oceanobacillus jeddahense]|uniref:Competence protein ComG n=1 Tax=Oceanobacillus jeddahense TaxID=1462527 RepID=A0ABY5JR35_9BACI|nr:hypothetical protein [Oceanobacillus jeddahense]UUI01327.1 hypothetical protein NP439_14815 [Oceanobacillus jeddahense]
MKKQFTMLHNQQGFLLLHVVWIILIIFLSIHFLLSQYQTAKEIVHNQLYHIEVETLSQMAYQKARKEIDEDEISSSFQAIYDFPQGEVTISFREELDDNIYILLFIKQKDSKHVYQLNKPFF